MKAMQANQVPRTGMFATVRNRSGIVSAVEPFAESWRRCKQGLAENLVAGESEVDAARRNVERDTGDDGG